VASLIGNSKPRLLGNPDSNDRARVVYHAADSPAKLFEEMKLREDRATCTDANVEDVSPTTSTAAKIIEDGRITTVSARTKNRIYRAWLPQ